ncbi:biliverdin-producing heme oxygenase [Luteolibacter sp. SL250]|uniref:biliverdin-producing heme oxygenase n=1 Tax=Luteolibacter sp. SL250 TaxID=2995170 RepID=UPI00226E669D|nr:biliverdin-producing heme oxygenase [Luteolibacter sp. SL250]WAC20413.1 biliverdin-producing heme oxygenase [Luteolibacter sp. SL250]
MNNLLPELRSATSALHRELDGLVPDPAADPAAYGAYLSHFHDGVAASWKMLDWGTLGALALPELSRRKQRYHALESDLERLAILHAKLRDHTGAGAAASTGCLYVLEGSIHGGRILLGKLSGHPDLPDDSLSFLTGFGDENGRMWASFMEWINHIDTTPGFIAEAREAAMRTFQHFINSFRQN